MLRRMEKQIRPKWEIIFWTTLPQQMENSVWWTGFPRWSIWISWRASLEQRWEVTWQRQWELIPEQFRMCLRQRSLRQWIRSSLRSQEESGTPCRLPWEMWETSCRTCLEVRWRLIPMHLQRHFRWIWQKMIWKSWWHPWQWARLLPMTIIWRSLDTRILRTRVRFPFIRRILRAKKK